MAPVSAGAHRVDAAVDRLRRCVITWSDAVRAAESTDAEGIEPLGHLLDELLRILDLDVVYLRLDDAERPVEAVRSSEPRWTLQPRELVALVEGTPPTGPLRTPGHVGDVAITVVFRRLGLRGDLGLLVAGSARTPFPAADDDRLIDSAAHLMAVARSESCLGREKETVASLRARALESKVILATIPSLVGTLSANGMPEEIHREILLFTGKSEEELRRWGMGDLVHPDDRPRAIESSMAGIASGAPYEIVYRMRRFDGAYRWFHARHRPQIDADGRVVRWFVTTTDIDDSKRAEEALRLETELQKAKDRLELGLKSSNLSIFEFDMPTGTLEGSGLTLVNFWEPLGYTGGPDTYDAAAMMGLVPPEDRLRVREAIKSYLDGTSPHFLVEHRVLHKNGSVQWRLTRGVTIRGENGAAVRLVGSHVDITERKRLEEQLQQAKDRLELSIRGSDVGIFDFEFPDGRIENAKTTFINNWGSMGWDPATARAAFAWDIEASTHPDDLPRINERIRDCLSGLEPHCSAEYRALEKDGTLAWRLLRGFALRDASGVPIRFMGTIVDVTALKHVEEELQRAREIAESANDAKDEFLAKVSHEIRTPMNAILGMTELALDSARDAHLRQMLTTVRTAARGLLGIINDLLDFSRMAAGKVALDPVIFALRDTLGDTLRALATRAHRKGIALVSHVHDDVPDALIGDAGRLRQILINLVDNGIKFTARGEVAVDVFLDSAASSNDAIFLMFKVRDTGIGIAPGRHAAIFRAFEQEETSTTRRYGGTGLGLTISAQIATLMGGQITVDSEPGRGATFCFSARFARASEGAKPDGLASAPEDRDTTPHPPAAMAGLRVLVAEDNELNVMLVTELLKQRGHLVRVVGDGRAALASAADGAFDVLLLDLHMPDMDGFAVAKAIRLREETTGRHLPIIALTARSSAQDRERSLAAGMDEFIPKPIERDTLFAAISQAVAENPQPKSPRLRLIGARAVLRMCGSQPAVLEKLCEVFRRTVPEALAQVRSALHDRDLNRLGEIVHKLAGTVGAFSSAADALSQTLQDAAAEGNFDLCVAEANRLEGICAELLEDTRALTIDALNARVAELEAAPRPALA